MGSFEPRAEVTQLTVGISRGISSGGISDAGVVAFCDFNGTIVDRDMLEYLASTTESAAQSVPLQLECGYRADIARRARALTYDRDEAELRIEQGIHFDHSFRAFADACKSAAVPLLVLTSGIEDLVRRYLARRGIDLPVFGNAAEYRSDGWRVQFRDDSVAGIDKRGFVHAAHSGDLRAIVIGDDRSDFEAALASDLTYAKTGSELERFLASQNRAFRPFQHFSEILDRWPPSTWPPKGVI